MSAIVTLESVGKRYRLRHRDTEPYLTLRDSIAQALSSPRAWFDRRRATANEDFWALRDVSFAIAPGEVVGVIGRNGAGKSTLLKILSRITEPTMGRVTLDGRVASLLEVGTGFHPELSGRENVYLNGAILGMTRQEIRNKFDSIVAFAEVERFLDTPVKRYSSGMYVRLAFAVAAHLEPEILIVDEVLAVGDASFQKKCLGKMQDASKGGRTVLFVSHNMAAVSSLTTRSVVLERGRVSFDGQSAAAIEHYTRTGKQVEALRQLGSGLHTAIRSVRLIDDEGGSLQHYTPGDPLTVEITLDTDGTPGMSLELLLRDGYGQKLALASSHQFHGVVLPVQRGRFRTILQLAGMWLASGSYSFDVATSIVNTSFDHYVEDVLEFEVISSNPGGESWDFRQAMGYGAFAMPCVERPAFVAAPDDTAA